MGVVKAHNIQIAIPGLALDADQLLGGNVIPVVGGIGPGIAGANRFLHFVAFLERFTEQDATALMGIGLLAMFADLGIDRLRDLQHQFLLRARAAHYCSQKRSLKYLSAESHRMVTITALRPAPCSSSAALRLPATAAAAEIPTNNPSVRAKCLAIS